MPGTAQKPPKQNRDMRQVLSTRGGSAAIAAVAALLAGVLLLVFLNQYRTSVNNDNKSATVLVAQRLIERGSSGDVIASQGLYQTSRVKKSELKDGALSDPTALQGQVAATDIPPGAQLTARDFTRGGNTIDSRLAGDQRAISIPLDTAHGMIGNVHTGDRVDVIGSYNVEPVGTGQTVQVTRILMQNVLVLSAPATASGGGVGGNGNQNVVLQAPNDKTAELAFSVDNGKIWIVDRPKAGAQNTTPSIVNIDSVLFDSKPIPTSSAAAQRALRQQAGGH